jgi:hypothetical protein
MCMAVETVPVGPIFDGNTGPTRSHLRYTDASMFSYAEATVAIDPTIPAAPEPPVNPADPQAPELAAIRHRLQLALSRLATDDIAFKDQITTELARLAG